MHCCAGRLGVHLGAHAVCREEELLGEGGVIHARVLAAHAQQRQVQPREQPRRRPVRRHCLEFCDTRPLVRQTVLHIPDNRPRHQPLSVNRFCIAHRLVLASVAADPFLTIKKGSSGKGDWMGRCAGLMSAAFT